MLWPDLARLESLQTIDDVLNWASSYQIRPLPWLMVSIPLFWAAVDCILLASRRFRDGPGNRISRWV